MEKLEIKVTNKDLLDVPNETIINLDRVYNIWKKDCMELMFYMTKHKHKIEAIREASNTYDRAILDVYNINYERVKRLSNKYIKRGYSCEM